MVPTKPKNGGVAEPTKLVSFSMVFQSPGYVLPWGPADPPGATGPGVAHLEGCGSGWLGEGAAVLL